MIGLGTIINSVSIVAGGAIPEMKDYEPKTKKKERQ